MAAVTSPSPEGVPAAVADVGPLRYVLLGVCLLYLLAAVGLRWSRCFTHRCRDCRRLPTAETGRWTISASP